MLRAAQLAQPRGCALGDTRSDGRNGIYWHRPAGCGPASGHIDPFLTAAARPSIVAHLNDNVHSSAPCAPMILPVLRHHHLSRHATGGTQPGSCNIRCGFARILLDVFTSLL